MSKELKGPDTCRRCELWVNSTQAVKGESGVRQAASAQQARPREIRAGKVFLEQQITQT